MAQSFHPSNEKGHPSILGNISLPFGLGLVFTIIPNNVV